MDPILALVVEALVFSVTAATAAGITLTVISSRKWRAFPRAWPQTILIAALVSVVVTEAWAQSSHVPRYAAPTMALCVLSAALMVIVQSRRHLEAIRSGQD